MLGRHSIAIALLISAGGLLCSCSNEPLDPEGTEGFLNTAFDGDWTWYEGSEALYRMTIENGRLVQMEPMQRNARRTTPAATNCDTDRRQGLVALAWHSDDTEDGIIWRTSTTFRFDLPGATAESCLRGLQQGILRGTRVVTRSDLDDRFPMPDLEQEPGELVRRD